MPARPAIVPTTLRQRAFRGSAAVAAGLLTPDQLRAPCYQRMFRDVYVHSSDPIDHRTLIVGASLLLPVGAVFAGRSALALAGCPDIAGVDDPVEVLISADRRFGPVRGLRIRRGALPASDVIPARTPRTTPLRSCLDIAREPDVVEAVVALDLALADRRIDARELTAAGEQLRGVRGARRGRAAIALADGRSESPPESRVGVHLALGGLPTVPQHVVRGRDGAFAARVDLAVVEQRVAIEYEGEWHAQRSQLRRDRQRLDRLAAAGWRVTHVTAADLYDPPALVARIRAFLIDVARAGLPG